MNHKQYQWFGWLSGVLRHARQGSFSEAAQTLVSCLDEPEDEADAAGQKRLFQHYDLRPYYLRIFSFMEPSIPLEKRAAVVTKLRNWGWNI